MLSYLHCLLHFYLLHFRHLQSVEVVADANEFDDRAVGAGEFPFRLAPADFLDGIGLDGVAVAVGERDVVRSGASYVRLSSFSGDVLRAVGVRAVLSPLFFIYVRCKNTGKVTRKLKIFLKILGENCFSIGWR